MLLMLFVDAARRGLETLPERLLVFVGHGPRLAPLVVEFLQLAERLDHRRFEDQRLGLLAEGNLLLVVLFQVEIAQLLVDLDEIVEILDMEVIGLPQVFDILLRHDAGLLPALLEFAELVERMVERLVRIDQLLQLLDDRLLDLQIGLFLGFEIGDEGVAALTVYLELLLELHFGSVHRRGEILLGAALLNETAACGLDLGAADAVEGDFQRLDIPADRLHGLLFEHPGKQRHQLLLAFAGELVRGVGRLPGQTVGGLLLGRFVLDLQSGVLRGERSLLVGEIHLHVGRRSLFGGFGHGFRRRLDAGALRPRSGLLGRGFLHGGSLFRPGRRLGRFGLPGSRFGGSLRNRSGFRFGRRLGGGIRGFGDFGSHGRGRLHIFSRRADRLFGSRKCRFFSSHLSTHFWFPYIYGESINLANVTILCGIRK